ncbi:Three-deoxy-D-manno-octulosonic-acid transferase domain protein [Candidatus Ruthia magnifica str. Cm (Calyptogena magnifica)]|uniref:3-deoxy-D-manno-octulosonic acid transferase n=1 Tax=Ruthia magnifica subsp. Calyptogena magnifica TaxID=413404 RepID=A1AW66_RUTMC|nr:lipid IV(A) 3-deoxy-D-manno-octulosonic acid transferase [Candidatus Ruthturnera calyptogenae]ABL02173.1 Three-deoxy-D-manno-octulosonic-acid transferase domain protein [Candidatus Ruthia magnifica str. Cm (Calyptogena magnifica)]
MNRSLYNIIGYLLLPFIILRLIIKSIKTPEFRQRINERLGLIAKIQTSIIWVHCVSMGEFKAAIIIIDQLIKQYPNHQLLITTTTPTSSNAVINHYKNKVFHLYFPYDLPLIVKRYIKKINPKICLLLETEIWPNLTHELNKNNIPILLINARLSQQSKEKYQRFTSNLIKQTLNKFTLIAAQNKNSANRFIELGTKNDDVIITGNIKFDQSTKPNIKINNILQAMVGRRKIVIFASTHEGEEAQIINEYLKHKHTIDALLVIIPRHPERFDVVYKSFKSANLNVIRRSENQPTQNAQILLGDSMGEMMSYFNIADIVFMGGSLSNTGGHNMLEPATLAKPIIFGPNIFNFTEISSDLLKQNAAIQIQNVAGLFKKIVMLLNDEKQCKVLGNNAQQYLYSKQGAVKNTLQLIKKFLTS